MAERVDADGGAESGGDSGAESGGDPGAESGGDPGAESGGDQGAESGGDQGAESGGDPKAESGGDPGTDREHEDGEHVEDVQSRLAALEAENRQLREEYARARQRQYRRTALGLALLGLLALGGSVLAPGERTVLLALAGTGFFGAVLTWTLTPEEFVAVDVSERIAAALAADRETLCAELGLQDDRIYVPADAEPVKLFVPQRPDFELPADLEGLLLVPEEPAARGVAFTPTGLSLHESVSERMAGRSPATQAGGDAGGGTDDPATDPGAVAARLADAVVEDLEFARAASVAPDQSGDAVAVRVDRPAFGTIDAIDHPVPSTIATGLARELDRPVESRVVDDDRADALLEFRLVDR